MTRMMRPGNDESARQLHGMASLSLSPQLRDRPGLRQRNIQSTQMHRRKTHAHTRSLAHNLRFCAMPLYSASFLSLSLSLLSLSSLSLSLRADDSRARARSPALSDPPSLCESGHVCNNVKVHSARVPVDFKVRHYHDLASSVAIQSTFR